MYCVLQNFPNAHVLDGSSCMIETKRMVEARKYKFDLALTQEFKQTKKLITKISEKKEIENKERI